MRPGAVLIKLDVDVEAQDLIAKMLLTRFPEHAFYGEEGIVGDQSSEHQWVVDPLDGTVNYFYRIPHFSDRLLGTAGH